MAEHGELYKRLCRVAKCLTELDIMPAEIGRSLRSPGRQFLLLLGPLLLVAGVLSYPQEEDTFQSAFDNFNVDEILNNDRILDTYVKCILETGPCSEHAAQVKGNIPEVFSTVCGRCNDKQKGIFKHSLEVFIPKRPDDWRKTLQMYDPKGEYEPKIMEFLKTWSPQS